MSAPVLVVIFTTILLGVLVLSDFRHRRLPNWLIVWYAVGFFAFVGVVSPTFSAFRPHFVMAVLSFSVLFVLFVLRVMGGGDVKLGTAVLLWSGTGLALPTVAVIAWTGGGLAVLGWLADRPGLQRLRWRPAACVMHALSARRGVPYGVALACGGWFVLWQHYRSLGGI